MNEFGEILGFWYMRGGSLNEIKPQLRGLDMRYQQNGFDSVENIYTDCPEKDREILEEIFRLQVILFLLKSSIEQLLNSYFTIRAGAAPRC